jgi:4-hydroxy-tetrahydrodipicolinate synthase
MTEMTTPPFGQVATAMVTPFTSTGEVNLDEAMKLARYLVDVQRNDALIINGTTGESPTTSDEEKFALLQAVREAVGNKTKIVAGVGTNDTSHSVHLAQQAKLAGADGLLVVTPYYSRPPQEALIKHFMTIADATDLPILLYDIPHRSGIPIEQSTIIELAKHPNIAGVKDAKGQVVSSAQVMAETDLVYYAGDDAMLLPLMSVGGVGVVGTSTHFTGAITRQIIDAYTSGDLATALELFRKVLPVYTGVFATQGVVMVKAGLKALGFEPGPVRLPMIDATEQQATIFANQLAQAGLLDAAS